MLPRLAWLLLVVVTGVLVTVGVGCNTAQGFGEDVESAGEAIQDKTK
ncbi:MAG: entericidin A/B family lipoprotein [Verrucomicrobiales bacterium]|nr:entericidin A/B family lipoprotein [Verrucomicrobiales bacterium]